MTTGIRSHRIISTQRMHEWLAGYLFAGPFIIGTIGFVMFPMVYSISLVFHSWDLLSPARFVGLANIQKAFSDPQVWASLGNSAFFTAVTVPIQLTISFLLALLLTQPIMGRSLYRAAFYLPVIVPIIATAVVWQRMLHPDYGLINTIIGWLGIPPQKWLLDPALAKPAFVIMALWMVGRQMVIFIAGLGNIPQELKEAAQIDGAGSLRMLTAVTIPMMTPLIFYNGLIAIINSFQMFIPAMIMTDGGPSNSTLFIVLLIYRQGFQFFNMGFASALAWELFIIVVGFTIAQFKISRSWVYYDN